MIRHATRLGALLCALATTMATAGSAQAAITPVPVTPAGADTYAESIFRSGDIIGTASFEIHPGGGSTAVSDGAMGAFPTAGTSFGIIATGLAASADDPNANVPDAPANQPIDDRAMRSTRAHEAAGT